jgi:glucose/arabinose dehydrogenase
LVRGSTLLKLLGVAGVVVLVAGAGAAGACHFTNLNCHLRQHSHANPLNPTSSAISLPDGFSAETVASGFQLPTDFAFLPDGRILVAEKVGIVKLVENGKVADKPLIDLRNRVNSQFFRGLMSVDVDPDFAKNHFVYVVYTVNRHATDPKSPTFVRVSRFTLSDGSTAGGEKVIIGAAGSKTGSCTTLPASTDCVPSDVDHIGADIAFGRDGTLFISTGDGGGQERVEATAFRAQDADALGGKVLHVTRDGRGLPSNPFYTGDVSANRSKVWVIGLRNPFRLTLAPGTDLPIVGEVGWTTFDEIDAAPAGANLGWPCYEGTGRTREYESTSFCKAMYHRATPVRAPTISLAHGASSSVTGGVFYTGSAYPSEYRGSYFYGDWAQGWIRYVRIDPSTGRATGRSTDFAGNAGGPVAFQMGPDGNLYYLSIGNGDVRRFAYTG